MNLDALYKELKAAKDAYAQFERDTRHWLKPLKREKKIAGERMAVLDNKIDFVKKERKVECNVMEKRSKRAMDEHASVAKRVTQISDKMVEIEREISILRNEWHVCEEDKKKAVRKMAELLDGVEKRREDLVKIDKYSYVLYFYFLLINKYNYIL